MKSKSTTERVEKQIVVHGKIHTIVEQDATRPAWQKGAYMGHEGFVLKRIQSVHDLVVNAKTE